MDFFDFWKLGSPLDAMAKLLLRCNFSALLRHDADSDDSSFHNEMCYGVNFAIPIEPVFSASIIIHSESASGNDASTDFTTEADLGKCAPKDLLSQQQGNDEGTKNFSFDHIVAEFDTSTEITQRFDEVDKEIKLEDLSKLNIKLEKEKVVAEAEAAFLFAQPSFPNVQHLTELLLKELPSKVSDINGAVGELKKYVEKLEIEFTGDLKVLPGKIEVFQYSVSALTSKVAALENIKLDLPD
ncbi:hypothetical protein Tco_0974664 [Tanacetum coccineum]|uniref:Uncharacterized protein n=1 Tax=Tanacetum coccineum TaxID=301880 RepID=A0ABQ5EDB8_9ASTR